MAPSENRYTLPISSELHANLSCRGAWVKSWLQCCTHIWRRHGRPVPRTSYPLFYPLITVDVTASDHNRPFSSIARVIKELTTSHDGQSKTISYAGLMAESLHFTNWDLSLSLHQRDTVGVHWFIHLHCIGYSDEQQHSHRNAVTALTICQQILPVLVGIDDSYRA